MWRDGAHLTPARVLRLAEHLPQGSATQAALRGSQWRGWSREAALLADLYDAIMTGVAVDVANYAGRKRVRPVADPYPRPSAQPRRLAARVADLPGAVAIAKP